MASFFKKMPSIAFGIDIRYVKELNIKYLQSYFQRNTDNSYSDLMVINGDLMVNHSDSSRIVFFQRRSGGLRLMVIAGRYFFHRLLKLRSSPVSLHFMI